MEKIKKISPNEIGLEVGLVLSRFFFNTEHLHFGYWPDDLIINIDNLKKAQDLHSNQILASIPEGVKTILDVGSGSGGLAEKLVENNYEVECVSPSSYLSDAIEQKLDSSVIVHRSTFESFDSQKKYDLILFSESFQYVNIDDVICTEQRVCSDKNIIPFAGTFDALLKINGQTVLFDLKTKNANKSVPTGELTNEALCQMQAYRICLKENHGIEVNRFIVNKQIKRRFSK